jgi:hypothetical protein
MFFSDIDEDAIVTDCGCWMLKDLAIIQRLSVSKTFISYEYIILPTIVFLLTDKETIQSSIVRN